MSEKQDRSYARTAQDIERKYSFGKTFADMLGLINDNRDKVDSVESELRDEITEQSTSLRRDATQIAMEAAETVRTELNELSKKVDLKVDASAVNIVVKEELANGVDRVVTESGYRFDSNGLNISKAGDEMENLLDNTGMYVTKSGNDILVANKDGVEATDLHAKTYLIVGAGDGRSRFEDYGINRTGCFWVGG